jgi:hypothetical protein
VQCVICRGDLKLTFALLADIGSFREAEDVLGIDRLWFFARRVFGLRKAWKHQRRQQRSAPQEARSEDTRFSSKAWVVRGQLQIW